jgi:hypothetical protein
MYDWIMENWGWRGGGYYLCTLLSARRIYAGKQIAPASGKGIS